MRPRRYPPALGRQEAALLYSAQNYYCPGWTEVQVQDRAAEKGAAIPSLLAACGATGAEVVACGDHLNDLGLFAVATRSIAPANAHPSVLESATTIVGSNDEDGVVRYLLDSTIKPSKADAASAGGDGGRLSRAGGCSGAAPAV